MFKKVVSGFLIGVIVAPYAAFAGVFAPVITFNGGEDLIVHVEGGASITDVTNALGSTTFTAVDGDSEEMSVEVTIYKETLAGTGITNLGTNSYPLTGGSVGFSTILSGIVPVDIGQYIIELTVTDTFETDFQTIRIVANTSPDISTNGDNTTPLIIQVDEDQLFTATSTITDIDGHTTSFLAHTGQDSEFFSFDTNTGVLTSLAPFNFEDAQDFDGNGRYRVVINGEDLYGKKTTQIIRVDVLDVANEPVFDPIAPSISINENDTVDLVTLSALDPELQEITLSLDSAAADSAAFTLKDFTASTTTSAYGATLEFTSAPDYENPTDDDFTNTYYPVVIAEDTDGHQTRITIPVFVEPINDNAPEFTQLGGGATSTKTILNNERVVTQLFATDGDIPVDTLTYTISGGTNAGLFQIVPANKRLRFIALPAIGTYEVSVQVSDGTNIDTQDITVTVLDSTVNYAPEIVNNGGATTTLSIAEGYTGIIQNVNATDLNGDTKFWSISGPDFGNFNMVSNNGRLQLLAALNYEAPADTNGDNVYEVLVSVSDYLTQALNPLSDAQTYFIEIMDVEERPDVSTSTVSIIENTATSTPESMWTLNVTDPQLDFDTATQATTTDMTFFDVVINNGAATIEISTNTVFDYEVPMDADLDNIYELDFVLNDIAGNSRDVTVYIEVLEENDNEPIISSGVNTGKYNELELELEEGETFVFDLEASDGDEDPLTWSIDGGLDMSLFTVASSTGVLEFATTTLFAAPVDSDANNIYEVTVAVSDGSSNYYVDVFVTIVADVPPKSGGGGGGSRNFRVAYDDEEDEEVVFNIADEDQDGTPDNIELTNPTFEQNPETPNEVLTTVGVTVTNADGTTETQDIELITTVDEDGEATTTLADPSQAAFILGAGVNALTWIALAVSLMAGIYLAYIRFLAPPFVAPPTPTPTPTTTTPPVTPTTTTPPKKP